jgi:predicted Zn-dependent peptidase
MLKMEPEMLSTPSSKRSKITLRAVCQVAGITEQTLHKKEHSLLKQEVRQWIDKLSPENVRYALDLKNNGAQKLKDANQQLSTLAAEILVLRKQAIDLEAANRRLRQKENLTR